MIVYFIIEHISFTWSYYHKKWYKWFHLCIWNYFWWIKASSVIIRWHHYYFLIRILLKKCLNIFLIFNKHNKSIIIDLIDYLRIIIYYIIIISAQYDLFILLKINHIFIFNYQDILQLNLDLWVYLINSRDLTNNLQSSIMFQLIIYSTINKRSIM